MYKSHCKSISCLHLDSDTSWFQPFTLAVKPFLKNHLFFRCLPKTSVNSYGTGFSQFPFLCKLYDFNEIKWRYMYNLPFCLVVLPFLCIFFTGTRIILLFLLEQELFLCFHVFSFVYGSVLLKERGQIMVLWYII